jgi:hypothetical protein
MRAVHYIPTFVRWNGFRCKKECSFSIYKAENSADTPDALPYFELRHGVHETVMKNLRKNFWQRQKNRAAEKPESPSEGGKAYSQKREGKESSGQTERDITHLKEAREIPSARFLRWMISTKEPNARTLKEHSTTCRIKESSRAW